MTRQCIFLDFPAKFMDDPEGVEREEEACDTEDHGHAVMGQKEEGGHHDSEYDCYRDRHDIPESELFVVQLLEIYNK